ncbi:hypothetical protein DLJ59_21185 [Micromonospora inaquosa]|uniref:Uncharacterized protein n=1 Tax=Micromonospora inaquosa TaxID=2203716 RepID=A0A3N9WHW7_9ACTN|nr:hypothetical protein DLJ59_21185 [Micromonospora inaquosa]
MWSRRPLSVTFGANSGLAAVAFMFGALRVAASVAFAVVVAGSSGSVMVSSVVGRSVAQPT